MNPSSSMTSKISSYILCIESKHKNKRVETLPKCPGSEGLLFKIARKSTAEEFFQAKNIVVMREGNSRLSGS